MAPSAQTRPYVDTRTGELVRLVAGVPAGADFVPVDEADAAAEERASRYDNPLAAAGLAFARGATLGTSDVLLTQTGAVAPSTLAGLSGENPVSSVGGEIAGTVASALIPGAPVARVAAGAARVASAIPQSGRVGAMLARLAAPAIEGGAFGVGQSISEAAQGGEVTAGGIARNVVAGAALGGLTSLAAMGIGAAASAGAKVAERIGEIGAKPTASANFARSLLDGQGVGVTGGMSARIALQSELDGLKGTLAGLRQAAKREGIDDAKRAAIAAGEQRIKAIGAEIGAIDAEMVPTLAKRAAARRTVTETESSKSGTRSTATKTSESSSAQSTSSRAESSSAQNVSSQAERMRESTRRKVQQGLALDADEAAQALDDELTHLTGEYEKTAGVIQTLQRELERYWNVGSTVPGARMGITPETGNRQLAGLYRYRDVLKEGMETNARMARELRRGQFQADGEVIADAMGAGRRVSSTVRDTVKSSSTVRDTRKVSEAVSTVTTEATTAPTSAASRTVRETISTPGVASQAERTAALQATESPISREILEEMAKQRTKGDFSAFAAWKSAPTILGAALAGAPGAAIGAALTSSTVREVVGSVAGHLMRLGPVAAARFGSAARAAITAPALSLSADDVDELRTRTSGPQHEPALVAEDAAAGYGSAGLPPDVSSRLAKYHGDRAAVMREALAGADTPRGRASLSRTISAVGDPRSIIGRLSVGDAFTREDATVLTRVFPELAAPAIEDAKRALASRDARKLAPGIRRNLMLLAGQASVLSSQVAGLQALSGGATGQDDGGGGLARGMGRASQMLATHAQTQLGAARQALAKG